MKLKNFDKKLLLYTNQDIFETIERSLLESKRSLLVVPHVCNNVNVFGGGFTQSVDEHYPIIKENFYLLGKQSILGYTQLITAKTNHKNNSKIVFANMIAQNGTIGKNNPRPLNYAALVKCMIDVKKFIEAENKTYDIDITQIHAPKFGSGLAGGKWPFIHDLIEDIWSSIGVTVHCLK